VVGTWALACAIISGENIFGGGVTRQFCEDNFLKSLLDQIESLLRTRRTHRATGGVDSCRMTVRMRLQRFGRIRAPFYRVVSNILLIPWQALPLTTIFY